LHLSVQANKNAITENCLISKSVYPRLHKLYPFTECTNYNAHSIEYVLSTHPIFKLKFLHMGEKECIKGPPITEVLSSSANLAKPFG